MITHEPWLGLCKLENEILKEAKNLKIAKKITFFDRKMSFLSLFIVFQNLIFQLAQP